MGKEGENPEYGEETAEWSSLASSRIDPWKFIGIGLSCVLQKPVFQKGIQPWSMVYNSQGNKFSSLVTQIMRGILERTD